MKKFKFTLQSVLNLKNSIEKQQRAELAAADARIRALEEELAAINLRHAVTRERFNREIREGISSTELLVYSTGFKVLRDKAAHQKRRILAAEEERRRIQLRLLETMKERKALEKLKARHLEEYREELRREDERIMDDFMSNKVTALLDGGANG